MASAAGKIMPANTDTVQVDSLVIMKIVKHFESERQLGGNPTARGYLTGLIAVEDRRLELTNCFQCRSASERQDDEEDLVKQQEEVQDMLRRFRNMNMDYQLLGFYISAAFGSTFNDDLIDSMFEYQSAFEDSVVLVYDNTKTSQGLLALKAYRLSAAAMDRCFNEFTPESVKALGLSFSRLFEELPVVVKNSHLVNVALAEISLLRHGPTSAPFLDLAHSGSMEKCIRGLMASLDTLNNETGRYNKYAALKAKYDAIRDTQMQKRKLENEARKARGEPELGMEDLLKIKQPLPHLMSDAFLAANEVDGHLSHALQVSAQNLGKLFLTEAVVDDASAKVLDRKASLVDHK